MIENRIKEVGVVLKGQIKNVKVDIPFSVRQAEVENHLDRVSEDPEGEALISSLPPEAVITVLIYRDKFIGVSLPEHHN